MLPRCLLSTFSAVLIAVLITACGGDTEDPETRLRETLDAMQQAAESRKVDKLMSHVSNSYLDNDGRDSRQIRAVAQFQFLRNPNIHSFKVIKKLDLLKDDEAELSILVAVASSPIDGVASIEKVRADMMWFDLRFQLEEEWKLVAAKWRPAESTDFL